MDVPIIPVEREYEPLGTGYSQSITVDGQDGKEYVAKGPTLVRNFRHVAANELVAAGLATKMGLPIPPYCILSRGKKLYFGSNRQDRTNHHIGLDNGLLARCSNIDKVYELVVFDAWICNLDRHAGNFLVRCSGTVSSATKQCPAAEHNFMVIDHDDCLLPDDRDVTHFTGRLLATQVSECIPLEFVRDQIMLPVRLGDAIRIAENISDEEIAKIINGVPVRWIPPEERPQWAGFLISRRKLLRSLFIAEREIFGWLKAGEL